MLVGFYIYIRICIYIYSYAYIPADEIMGGSALGVLIGIVHAFMRK